MVDPYSNKLMHPSEKYLKLGENFYSGKHITLAQLRWIYVAWAFSDLLKWTLFLQELPSHITSENPTWLPTYCSLSDLFPNNQGQDSW